MQRFVLFALMAAAALGACDAAPQPPGHAVTVTVSPLALPGIDNAEYRIIVRVGATTLEDVVVDADRFGDAASSISFVAPCEAGVDNTVSVELLRLWDGPGADDVLDPSTWVNPGPIERTVACLANADAAVTFDLTILRDAAQGFFDVAVAIDEVFCSAKLDCVDDEGQPLMLLHDGVARGRSVVAALACVGPELPILYMSDVTLACAASSVVVDPSAGPGNLTYGAGISGAPGVLFGAAVYRGEDDAAYAQRFWNVVLGLDDAADGCTLTAEATVSARVWDLGATPAGAVYPYLRWSVPITDASGLVTCGHHPTNGSGDAAGLDTVYTTGAAHTFAHAFGAPPPPPPPPGNDLIGALSAADPGRWDDGTHARSCAAYLHPDVGHEVGAVTSGVYRIDLDGSAAAAPIDVYCDMVTDGGGWTRVVAAVGAGTVNAQGAARASELLGPFGAQFAKLADVDIRALAIGGAREYLMHKPGASATSYVLRTTEAAWSVFDSTGWTNLRYDSKDAGGTWHLGRCNGHYNTRGFSSISDSPMEWSGCGVVFAGPPVYLATYHTFGSMPGAPFWVYVR